MGKQESAKITIDNITTELQGSEHFVNEQINKILSAIPKNASVSTKDKEEREDRQSLLNNYSSNAVAHGSYLLLWQSCFLLPSKFLFP